jgi:hypothetical protein
MNKVTAAVREAARTASVKLLILAFLSLPAHGVATEPRDLTDELV